jgi:LPS export ABC transporter protein LptC
MRAPLIVLRFCLFLFFLMGSCVTKENKKPVLYNGPVQEGKDIEMHYVEKQVVKMKMVAKKILEMQNGDRDFPEGIYLEFYDEFGKLTSTLRADKAFYFKEDDKWRGRGKVEVKNMEKNQQLNTEELFWKPLTKKIFTDKFVTIKTEDEIIYGTGLDAFQDLSNYKITHPEGLFSMTE